MIKIFCDEDCEFYTQIADKTYKYLGISGNCSVELVITLDEEIRELNAKFRGIDQTTDVLSFPSITFSNGLKKFSKENYPHDFDVDSNTVVLGSIVINDNKAVQQAKEYGHSVERERGYLFLHGLLHVFGFDHMDESDKNIMREVEENILAKFGLGIERRE